MTRYFCPVSLFQARNTPVAVMSFVSTSSTTIPGSGRLCDCCTEGATVATDWYGGIAGGGGRLRQGQRMAQ